MQWWGGYPAGRRNLYTTTEFGAALFPNTVSATTLTSTVATGTAPLTITSTTEVANLNAALLNGVASATTNTNNTIVRRDGSGDFTSNVVTVNQLISTNNGNGTNVRIGDDCWVGDINVANTFRVQGVQNADRGFITFGNSFLCISKSIIPLSRRNSAR